ncbi:hypothetical protein ACS0TY_024584 [Phlomoides rotata]
MAQFHRWQVALYGSLLFLRRPRALTPDLLIMMHVRCIYSGDFALRIDHDLHVAFLRSVGGLLILDGIRGFFVAAFMEPMGWGFPLDAELAAGLLAIQHAHKFGWQNL